MEPRKIHYWIITSTEDIASLSIREYLLKNFNFTRIKESKQDPIQATISDDILWEGNPVYRLKIDNKLASNNRFASNNKFAPDILDNIEISLRLTNTPMIFVDQDLTSEEVEKKYWGDFIIFASRHKSESQKPAFLTHVTGNWNTETGHGGRPNRISISSGMLVRYGYSNLQKEARLAKSRNIDWNVDLEVDHHGPTEISSPIMFMELGSSENEWGNQDAAAVVAHAIINTILEYVTILFSYVDINPLIEQSPKFTKKQLYEQIKKGLGTQKGLTFAIGFGGNHYAQNFSSIYDEEGDEKGNENGDKNGDAGGNENAGRKPSIFISHIVPKYHILGLTKDQINAMVANSLEPIQVAIIDWKGVNSQEKNHIIALLDNTGIEIKKTKDFHVV